MNVCFKDENQFKKKSMTQNFHVDANFAPGLTKSNRQLSGLEIPFTKISVLTMFKYIPAALYYISKK